MLLATHLINIFELEEKIRKWKCRGSVVTQDHARTFMQRYLSISIVMQMLALTGTFFH